MQVGDILISSFYAEELEILHIHDNNVFMVKDDKGVYYVYHLGYISRYYNIKNNYEVDNIFKFTGITHDKSLLYKIMANFYDSNQEKNYVVLQIINPIAGFTYAPFIKTEDELKDKKNWEWVKKESNV